MISENWTFGRFKTALQVGSFWWFKTARRLRYFANGTRPLPGHLEFIVRRFDFNSSFNFCQKLDPSAFPFVNHAGLTVYSSPAILTSSLCKKSHRGLILTDSWVPLGIILQMAVGRKIRPGY
jgi:hypothetical protein